MANWSEEDVVLWRKARELAKEMYENDDNGDWDEADKYEREDYVWAAYEKLKKQKGNETMSKLRVWWIPQIGIEKAFYVPVKTVEEGKKVLDTLAVYDMFQFENNIKPDFSNVGGLQMFDEEYQEWNDWHSDDYEYDDVDEYCESDDCEQKDELEEFRQAVFGQIDFDEN